MILIGRDLSPFVRRTAIVLALSGLNFERRKLASAKPGDLVEIKKLNPLGRVPALILDDGEALIDSNAIIDYAMEISTSGVSLCPADGAARRQILRTSAFAVGVMEKGVASSYETLTRPADKVHQPWLDHILGQITEGLTVLEELGANRNIKTDPAPTLADVNSVVAHDFITLIRPELARAAAPNALPELSRHFNSLPAFKNNQWQPNKS
jgi:glutathione S-transferase